MIIIEYYMKKYIWNFNRTVWSFQNPFMYSMWHPNLSLFNFHWKFPSKCVWHLTVRNWLKKPIKLEKHNLTFCEFLITITNVYEKSTISHWIIEVMNTKDKNTETERKKTNWDITYFIARVAIAENKKIATCSQNRSELPNENKEPPS